MNDKTEEDERPELKGTLKKLKSSSFSQIFGKTNLRYFEVNYKYHVFGYRDNQDDKLLKKSHKFSEIFDFTEKVSDLDQSKCDWKFGFTVKTKDKEYILFCQSDQELKKWIYAMNIILKRIPESFPKISDLVFRAALNIFYHPYVKEQQRLVDEKRKQLEMERLRKIREEEDRKRKLEEERLKNLRDEEERKRKLEEERLRKIKEEEERRRLEELNKKKKYQLYDEFHESIIKEAEQKPDEVNQPHEKVNVVLPQAIAKNENQKKRNKSVNFQEEDIHDWNFYDDKNKLIDEKELINFNPVLSKQNKKIGIAFHSVIKGYMDPNVSRSQMHLENMHPQKSTKVEEIVESASNKEIKKLFGPHKEFKELKDNMNNTNSLNKNNNQNHNLPYSPLKSIIAQRKIVVDEDDPISYVKGFIEGAVIEKITLDAKKEKEISLKKEVLLNSLNVNPSKKNPSNKRTSIIDVNVINKGEVYLKLKDVSTNSQNIMKTMVESYIQPKQTIYKRDSMVLNNDNMDNILSNNTIINTDQNKFIDEEKKKKFENLYFKKGERKIELKNEEIESEIDFENKHESTIKNSENIQKNNLKNDFRFTLADPTNIYTFNDNPTKSIDLNPNLNPSTNNQKNGKNDIFGLNEEADFDTFLIDQPKTNFTNKIRSEIKKEVSTTNPATLSVNKNINQSANEPNELLIKNEVKTNIDNLSLKNPNNFQTKSNDNKIGKISKISKLSSSKNNVAINLSFEEDIQKILHNNSNIDPKHNLNESNFNYNKEHDLVISNSFKFNDNGDIDDFL